MPATPQTDKQTIERIRQLLTQGLKPPVIRDRLRVKIAMVYKIRKAMRSEAAKLTEPRSEA